MKNKTFVDSTQGVFTNTVMNPFLILEICFISVVLGTCTSSWLVFGASLAGLVIILNVVKLRVILCVVLSIIWGAAGFGIGYIISSIGAEITLGILLLAISWGLNTLELNMM